MRQSAQYVKTQTWNKDLTVGDKIEGYYTNKEVFEGNYGMSTKYVLDVNGEKFGIYGSASIDRQFKNIPLNAYVWVEYEGEVKTKNGRTVKQYKVEYDTTYEA